MFALYLKKIFSYNSNMKLYTNVHKFGVGNKFVVSFTHLGSFLFDQKYRIQQK